MGHGTTSTTDNNRTETQLVHEHLFTNKKTL